MFDPEDILTRARATLELLVTDVLHKGIWGSPMGKTYLARRIVAEIPAHRTYVEPFAGGGQVLFAKSPSAVEVVGDLDPEIAFAFRFVKEVTSAQMDQLRRKKWVGDKAHFKRLEQSEVPKDPIKRFYRFAYLTRFSFNKLRRGTMSDQLEGVPSRFMDKLARHAPRLRKVEVRHADFEEVIQAFDGPDTFFFLDPPYAGYDADARSGAGHKEWDEDRFKAVLQKIRGRFLCTYGVRGASDLFQNFHVRKWQHPSGEGTQRGRGMQTGATLVVTNYPPRKTPHTSESSVTKTIWGSPAGKKRLADRLVKMLPAHKTYVEPFAGSGAVLFAKDPAAVEVLGDADPEIAQAYQALRRLDKSQLARLRRMAWVGDKDTFLRLFDAKPTDPVEKLHRFLYLSHFSYGKLRGRSFNPGSAGVQARTLDRIATFGPRLKNVRIHSGDYQTLVKTYDAPDTVFFFDPPYAGYDVDVGEQAFDEVRFFEILKNLKGKFLLTYGIRGRLPGLLKKAGFLMKRIRTPRSISAMRGVGGASVLTQLVVANYDFVSKGRLNAPASHTNVFAKSIPLIKGVDPEDERFVLGIVLEPEVVDAQADIYSPEEIRQAAHRFMEEFGGLGLMHRLRVNDQVKVLESYIAPVDFTVGDLTVRKGTWLLAVRILSDELWAQVKSGALTGFSIGGSARRRPEHVSASQEAA